METGHNQQTTPPTARVRRGHPRRIRWTRKEYARLHRLNFFVDRRVELIYGQIYLRANDPPHEAASGLLVDALEAAFPSGYHVRPRFPLDVCRRSFPQPDAAVVRGSIRDYATAHPTSATLVAEVSESSLAFDRGVKAHLYASAEIGDYWIINLVDRQLEVYRNPGPDPARKGRFRYADVTIIPATGHATPLNAPGAVIAVADLLP